MDGVGKVHVGPFGIGLGHDPQLGELLAEAGERLERVAGALFVEKGEGLVEKGELIPLDPPRQELLGERQAQGEHDLALGAAGDFVQGEEIVLVR